jgi:glycosyltransferase involved in cell wall biosynthesis
MWDDVAYRPAEWWSQFPRTLKVVAFSDGVADAAERVGIPTLRLRYYPDPASQTATAWDNGRVLFYWNRKGLAGPRFLERLCGALAINWLLFRDEMDPGSPSVREFSLPSRIGHTRVVRVPGFGTVEQYREAIRPANIILAPRILEGVGLTFLDAMARGCAVLAYDAPTMNEYIRHGENGYLLPARRAAGMTRRIAQGLARRLPFATPTPKQGSCYALTEDQDWHALRRAPLQALGAAALRSCIAGHDRWTQKTGDYARFVLDW